MDSVPTKLQVQSNQPTKTVTTTLKIQGRVETQLKIPVGSVFETVSTILEESIFISFQDPLEKKDMFHQRNEGYKTRNTNRSKRYISLISLSKS